MCNNFIQSYLLPRKTKQYSEINSSLHLQNPYFPCNAENLSIFSLELEEKSSVYAIDEPFLLLFSDIYSERDLSKKGSNMVTQLLRNLSIFFYFAVVEK